MICTALVPRICAFKKLQHLFWGILFLLPTGLFAQNYPTDAKVLEDVKKYHGKIATAKVQNEWKLEKEAGYTFSNMAKRVVAATTVKENGVSKNLIGLAIYTRGSASDKWTFSRYFVTSSETTGLTMLTEAQIREQTLELLRTNPGQVLVTFSEVAWVYDITFPEGLTYETDRTGDLMYKGSIGYEYKFIRSYPFEGGIRRYQNPLEIYVRVKDGAYRVAVASVLNRDPIKETLMTEKQYNALPTLSQKPFDELFGPQGLAVPAETGKKEEKSGVKLPKVKTLMKN